MNGKEYTEKATEYLLKKEYDKAMEYYLKASDEGYYFAMYNIACMYYFGDGVEKDDQKAFSWYLKAYEHGDAEAGNRVGVMY